MNYIKRSKQFKDTKNVSEAVVQIDDTYKVGGINVPQSLINSYVKKVKDETGKDLRHMFSDMDIASELVKFTTDKYLVSDELPITALLGGEVEQEEEEDFDDDVETEDVTEEDSNEDDADTEEQEESDEVVDAEDVDEVEEDGLEDDDLDTDTEEDSDDDEFEEATDTEETEEDEDEEAGSDETEEDEDEDLPV